MKTTIISLLVFFACSASAKKNDMAVVCPDFTSSQAYAIIVGDNGKEDVKVELVSRRNVEELKTDNSNGGTVVRKGEFIQADLIENQLGITHLSLNHLMGRNDLFLAVSYGFNFSSGVACRKVPLENYRSWIHTVLY